MDGEGDQTANGNGEGLWDDVFRHQSHERLLGRHSKISGAPIDTEQGNYRESTCIIYSKPRKLMRCSTRKTVKETKILFHFAIYPTTGKVETYFADLHAAPIFLTIVSTIQLILKLSGKFLVRLLALSSPRDRRPIDAWNWRSANIGDRDRNWRSGHEAIIARCGWTGH